MEVYNLGNIIENKGIEIQLILHQLDEAREELKKSLKRRKEIAIAEITHNIKRLTLPSYLLMMNPINLM